MSDIALFEENIRLAMKNMGLFMDSICLGDQKLEFSLGHGVYLSENGSISDVKIVTTGQDKKTAGSN